MPVAKPKHIRAKSDKQFKTPEGEYYNPDVMSENMFALLEHLKEKNLISDMYVGHEGQKDLGIGNYAPGNKSLAVIAENPNIGNSVIAHELTHALNWSDTQSKEQKIKEMLEKDPRLEKDLVFPSRWEQKRVAAPLTNRFIGHSFAGSPDIDRSKKLSQMFQDTAEHRTRTVRGSIPEYYTSWSGLKPSTDPNVEIKAEEQEEGQAYYMTDPKVATPMGERAKDFGMFLRSYGVPMELVAPVVEDLSRTKIPEAEYSGGSFNLRKLRDEKRRRTVND